MNKIFFLIIISVLAVLTSIVLLLKVQEPPTPVKVKELRALLTYIDDDGDETTSPRKKLIEMGERAFPAYQAILGDPGNPGEMARIFDILRT